MRSRSTPPVVIALALSALACGCVSDSGDAVQTSERAVLVRGDNFERFEAFGFINIPWEVDQSCLGECGPPPSHHACTIATNSDRVIIAKSLPVGLRETTVNDCEYDLMYGGWTTGTVEVEALLTEGEIDAHHELLFPGTYGCYFDAYPRAHWLIAFRRIEGADHVAFCFPLETYEGLGLFPLPPARTPETMDTPHAALRGDIDAISNRLTQALGDFEATCSRQHASGAREQALELITSPSSHCAHRVHVEPDEDGHISPFDFD